MTPLAILLLSLSMSADAFAAAVGKGAAHRPTLNNALKGGLVFGVVETVTPIIGWFLGSLASGLVESIDHWIAFALLGLVGAHLIREGLSARREERGETGIDPLKAGLPVFILTAVGTSIDAAAVGVSLAFLDVNIWIVAAAIGVSTFILTTIGMLIGSRAGEWLGKTAEIIGGVILIGIGTTILLEHLGYLR
ncbi:MAG: manganese efflux pump MntP family protein [Sphingomonadaceae bacterium]